jgi:hypothetical protein
LASLLPLHCLWAHLRLACQATPMLLLPAKQVLPSEGAKTDGTIVVVDKNKN